MERHEISVQVPDREPRIESWAEAVEEARYRALAWAEANGLELTDLSRFARTAGHDSGPAVGVSWTVTLGKGQLAHPPAETFPPEGDSWVWSGRIGFWWALWDNIRQARRRSERLTARRSGDDGKVVPGPWRGPDALRGPARHNTGKVHAAMGVGVEGCTCHIGGPFRDICPVHFDDRAH